MIVALTVTPADGFISRLLQQTHTSARKVPAGKAQPAAVKADQSSISQEARQANQSSSHQQMESKLMDLYNQKGRNAA